MRIVFETSSILRLLSLFIIALLFSNIRYLIEKLSDPREPERNQLT